MSQVRGQRITIMCGALVLLAALLMPVGAMAQGNSEAAQLCEDGGYLDYTRTNGTSFKNEGQCTRYAAQGGVLKPVSTAGLFITFGDFLYDNNGIPIFVTTTFSGSGLLANSLIRFQGMSLNGDGSDRPAFGQVASDGSYLLNTSTLCGYWDYYTLSGTAAGGSPVSVTVADFPC